MASNDEMEETEKSVKRNKRSRSRRRKGRTWRARLRRAEYLRNVSIEIRGIVDTRRETIDFMRWLSRSGMQNPNRLTIYDFGAKNGRGVKTRQRAIEPDGRLITIPLQCLMFRRALLDEDNCDAFRQICVDHSVSDEVAFISFLMYQRENLDRSRWSPYLRTLPADYDLPFMRDALLRSIERIPVSRYFTTKLAEAAANMAAIRDELRATIDTFRLPIIFDEAQFRWAYGALNTRAINPDLVIDDADDRMSNQQANDRFGHTVMIPFFDLFNHSSNRAKSQIVISMMNGDGAGKHYEAYSKIGLPPHREVWFNYDAYMNNAECFVEYGFAQTELGSPTSCINDSTLTMKRLRVRPTEMDRINFDFDDVRAAFESMRSDRSWHAKKVYLATRDRFDTLLHRLRRAFESRPHTKGRVFQISWPFSVTRYAKPLIVHIEDDDEDDEDYFPQNEHNSIELNLVRIVEDDEDYDYDYDWPNRQGVKKKNNKKRDTNIAEMQRDIPWISSSLIEMYAALATNASVIPNLFHRDDDDGDDEDTDMSRTCLDPEIDFNFTTESMAIFGAFQLALIEHLLKREYGGGALFDSHHSFDDYSQNFTTVKDVNRYLGELERQLSQCDAMAACATEVVAIFRNELALLLFAKHQIEQMMASG